MDDQYRIAVIGTKKPNRKYLSYDRTGEKVAIVGREEALHWPKKIASLITAELNREFQAIGRVESFQIEKA